MPSVLEFFSPEIASAVRAQSDKELSPHSGGRYSRVPAAETTAAVEITSAIRGEKEDEEREEERPDVPSSSGGRSTYDERSDHGERNIRDHQSIACPERPTWREDEEAEMLSDWVARELQAACQRCRADQILCTRSKPCCFYCQQLGDGTCNYNPPAHKGSFHAPLSKIKAWILRPTGRSTTSSGEEGQMLPSCASPSPLPPPSPPPSSSPEEEECAGRVNDEANKKEKGMLRKPFTGSAMAWVVNALASRTSSMGGKQKDKKGQNSEAEVSLDVHSAWLAPPHVSPVSSKARTRVSSSHTSATSFSRTQLPSRPEPFQCTHCLTQCTFKYQWKLHESSHFPQKTLSGGTESGSRYYWDCGFCDYLATSWEDRLEHIGGEHYEGQGLTMGDWDPRTTSAPLRKASLRPVQGYRPSWDAEGLLAMQRLTNNDNTHFQPFSAAMPCRQCNIYFRTIEQSERHLKVYHESSESWSLPLFDTQPNTPFFVPLLDTENVSSAPTHEVCQFCEAKFTASPAPDWDERLEHLREKHRFHGCGCVQGEKFFKQSRFVRHLAEYHDFALGNGSNNFVKICRKVEKPLALVLGLTIKKAEAANKEAIENEIVEN